MTPLTTLVNKVEDYAHSCLDDTILENEKTPGCFTTGQNGDPSYMMLGVAGGAMTHGFTEWSRTQLLQHLGTKEKWFDSVAPAQEAAELNARIHCLKKSVIRRRRLPEPTPQGTHIEIRGFVSKSYVEIPDTAVVRALEDACGFDAMCVSRRTEKTDRALYVYVVSPQPVTIPGSSQTVWTGIVASNSEVGYSSLRIAPVIYVGGIHRPVNLGTNLSLRLVHRGDHTALKQDFKIAVDQAKTICGDLVQRMAALRNLTYGSADEAVQALRVALDRAKAQKSTALAAERAYCDAAGTLHHGLGILEAVLTATEDVTDNNKAYTNASTAGAVLIGLLR